MSKVVNIHTRDEILPEHPPESFFTIKGPAEGPFSFEFNQVSPQMVIRIRSLCAYFEGVLDSIIQGVEEEEDG